MALTTCPECQKQVSDQAQTCPHCGFTLAAFPKDTTPPDFSQDTILNFSEVIVPKQKHHNKKTVIIVCILLAVIIAGFAVFFVKHSADQKAEAARAQYIQELNFFALDALSGAAASEKLCNLTAQVWLDTIVEDDRPETRKFTQSRGVFHEDFNDALVALYSDSETQKAVSLIKESQDSVREHYKNLSNYTDEFERCYTVAGDLYAAFSQFTDFALNPSGSYNSYSDNFQKYDDSFMSLYNKFEVLIPEE